MSQVAQVKDAVSIVEIINERVALTPSGNYHRGLCPFHGEKSPSFFVDERIGHFRCFGCGESGDVLAFLEKYDSLTFREALEYLADRAGITLTKHVASSQDLLRARSLEALAAAAEFYQQNLGNSSLGQQAKNYLKNRQVSSNTIKYFGLGVATAGWQDLADHLQKKGFTRQEMVAAGLVIEKKTGGIFDRFRMRLMFPLKNHRGQVVGFSGRLLAEKEGEAKYINSPETALYHKGKMLYGLSENAQEIKKKNAMIIVEGEFDMISSYQAHVENVVAIKGSALTSDHAQIIARYTNLVYLALDGDEAGVKATHKAVSVLREVGVELKVVMSPGGQDPDDFARQDPGGWRKAVAKAVSAYEYFLIVTSKKYDLSTTTATLENKKTALKELAPLFATIDSLIEKNHYLKKIAVLLGEEFELVGQEMERLSLLNAEKKPPTIKQEKTAIVGSTSDRKAKPTIQQKLEMYLWFLFLQTLDEPQLENRVKFLVDNKYWQSTLASQLVQFWQEYQKKSSKPFNLKNFITTLPADYQEKIADLSLNKTYTKWSLNIKLLEEWQRVLIKYQQLIFQNCLQSLNKELGLLDSKNELTDEEEAKQTQLLSEIVSLQKQLKNLK